MRRAAFLILILMVAILTGCALSDAFFGVDSKTGERTAPPGKAPAEIVGRLLDPWIPWAGMGLSVIGGLYVNGRRKRYLKLASTAFDAVSEVKRQKDKDGKVDLGVLLAALARKQDAEGVRDAARKMANKIEGKTSS